MAVRSIVSNATTRDITGASWIRRMFEEAGKVTKQYGENRVFNFTLGNPNIEPPEAFRRRLVEVARDKTPDQHAYMENAGFEYVRADVAAYLSASQGLSAPLTAKNVVMTCGAGGALHVIFESVLDEGDEVLVPSPYFVEYGFYVTRHRGKLVPVESKEDFQLDLEKIEAAIRKIFFLQRFLIPESLALLMPQPLCREQ